MSNFKQLTILVKTEFMKFLGSLKYRKKKGAYVAGSALVYLGSIILIAYLAYQSFMQTATFSSIGVPLLGIEMNLLTCLLFGFMVSLMQLTSNQKTNDSNLLLSLPIKKGIVILSKTLTKYIYVFIITFVILLPSFISYVVINNASLSVIGLGLLFIVLLPLFFTAISQILTVFITSISSKFKFSEHIGTVIMMVFLCGYMMLTFSTTSLITDASLTANSTSSTFGIFPFTTVLDFVIRGDIVSILLIAAICIIPFYISILMYKKNFGVEVAVYKSKDTNYVVTDTNINKSLYKKEVKRYFGCSVYVFNTIFGSVLLVLFSVMSIFDVGISSFLHQIPDADSYKPMIYLIVFAFCVLMSSTTSSSISLEGKYLWLIRSMPINPYQLFIAKIKVNLLITIPFILIGGVIVSIAEGFMIFDIINILVIPSLLACTIAVLGLIINLLMPKFDWDTELKVVKQSVSVLLTITLGLALLILPIILYTMLSSSISWQAFSYIIMGVLAIIILIALRFIKTKGVKIFNNY